MYERAIQAVGTMYATARCAAARCFETTRVIPHAYGHQPKVQPMVSRITRLERSGRAPPPDVYYVVQSSGTVRRRDHEVISPLYETRRQADAELARLRTGKTKGVLSVWMRTAQEEPPQWLSDVIMADGTVIHAPK